MSPEVKNTTVEFSPGSEVALRIPANLFRGKRAETINIRRELLEGDWNICVDNPNWAIYLDNPIRIKTEVKDFSKSPDFLKKMVDLGARVLKTKRDNLLVVHSEESLEYSKEIQKPKEQKEVILGREVLIKTEFCPLKTNIPYTTYSVDTLVDGKEWKGKYYYQSGKMIKGPWEGTYFEGGMSGLTIETDAEKVIGHVIESVIDFAQNPHKPSIITG